MRPLVKIGESFVLHIACESFDGVQSDIDPVGVTATIIWLILIYKTTSHTEPGFYLRRSHAGQWMTFGFLRKIESLEAVRGQGSMAT